MAVAARADDPAGAQRDVSEPTSESHGAMEAHDAERNGLFFQGPDGQPQFVSAAALGRVRG
jgi:hypothetical protein